MNPQTYSIPSTQIQSFDQILIQCPTNNQAFQYCINQKCQAKSVFTCTVRKCTCHSQHSLCPKTYIDSSLKIIKQKIYDPKQLKQYVDDTINKLVDELSNFRDGLISELQDKMKYINLQQCQIQFYKICKGKQNCEEFRQKQSLKLWNQLNKAKVSKEDKLQTIKSQLNVYCKQIQDYTNRISKKITQYMESSTELLKYQLPKAKNKILEKSSIFPNKQQLQKLINFFPKGISKIQLKFKASQNQFNINNFFEKCGDIANIMIIAKTNKDKIIGAFSPFSLNPILGQNQWVKDQKKQSFLFSLTQNDKFQLKKQVLALCRNKADIYFGCSQFKIHNNSNQKACYGYLTNKRYINEKYVNDKNSYLKWNGNQNHQFTTKQWQAYALEFQD